MKHKHMEVEQKYRIASPASIRRLILRLGGRKIASGAEYNELFDRPGGELRRRKCVLRLRKHGKKCTLTYKGPRLQGPFKQRVEVETEADFKSMKKILEMTGYKRILVYRKSREEYRLGRAHVTLDQLTGIGWFCEIEGTASSIRALEKKLGLSDEDVEDRTYLELLGKKA